jgi:hypothetical protein
VPNDEALEQDKDNDDDDDDDDDMYDGEADHHKMPSNRKMFLFPCDCKKKENAYYGNVGSANFETYYYAAAVIVSLMKDTSLLESAVNKK